MPLKVYILNMVGSKQLNSKLKTTLKISWRTRQVAVATPTTPPTEENNEDLLETIRKIITEQVEDHQGKVSEIIKCHVTNTNECLDKKISQEAAELAKSLEFTQEELHDGLANVENGIKKFQTDLREIEHDLLDSTSTMEKLTELKDRSRRSNVRIDGIPKLSNEAWESCKEE